MTPEEQFFDHARRSTIPKMKECAFNLVIFGDPDPKLCLEIGASILLNKPILVLARESQQIPLSLRTIAHKIVVLEDDYMSERSRQLTRDAVNEMMTWIRSNPPPPPPGGMSHPAFLGMTTIGTGATSGPSCLARTDVSSTTRPSSRRSRSDCVPRTQTPRRSAIFIRARLKLPSIWLNVRALGPRRYISQRNRWPRRRLPS
jgi:hypothetical protein